MPLIDHNALIKPNQDLIIWRYLDLDKFECLLSEKGLFFCRSDKFSDPFEGSIPKKESDFRVITEMELAEIHKRKITHEEAVKNSNKTGTLHKELKRSFTVNCWHINQGESDAMWRLYLKSNEGVAIQSTVQRLHQSLDGFGEEIYITKVRYIDFDKDVWFHRELYPRKSYNIFTPIVHKRMAFAHESELRVFQQINEAVRNENYWDKKPNHMGNLIPTDIDNLIEKIILPPTADDDVKDKVVDLLKKYDLVRDIEQSKLNEEPTY